MEGEREKIDTSSKRICPNRVDSPDMDRTLFEAFGSSFVVENFGISVDLSLCVPASPPVVPMVTVPFSDVNVSVVCGVVFL